MCIWLCVCILFALPIRIWLLVVVFLFLHKFGKKIDTMGNKVCRMKHRGKSEGRFIVLLMRVVEYFVYTSHFTVFFSLYIFFAFSLALAIRMLFTTYFDFYDFYSSLSHTFSCCSVLFSVKIVQLEIDIEFICNRMCQC